MGMTSQAEARLDASIRPAITVLRSRTSYPPRHRPGLAASAADSPSTTGGDAVAVAGPSTQRGAGARGAAPEPGPVRLTRRGRVVVGVLIAVGVVALAGLLWLTIDGQAQASGQVTGGGLRAERGLVRVVVRPGQTLWSIAVRADPGTDPRDVVGEMISDNELSGTTLHAGEVLWVPRG